MKSKLAVRKLGGGGREGEGGGGRDGGGEGDRDIQRGERLSWISVQFRNELR